LKKLLIKALIGVGNDQLDSNAALFLLLS